MSGFWYLASPYSHPTASVREARYRLAEAATAWCLRQMIWIYSPIVHCHEMAFRYSFPTDAKYWEDYNYTMLEAAQGLIVLLIDGWKDSKGIAGEVGFALANAKVVRELEPGLNVNQWVFGSGIWSLRSVAP